MSMPQEALLDLAAQLGLSPVVVARRLEVLGLGREERASLRELAPTVLAQTPRALDAFYERLLRCPSTRGWLGGGELLGRLKQQQAGYLAALFGGELDWQHALDCLRIGVVHHRVRLTPQWFVASYGHLLCEHISLILRSGGSPEAGMERLITLVKTALFDASLALEGYSMSVESGLVAEGAVPERRDAKRADADAPASTSPTTPSISRTRVAHDDASERAAFLGIDDDVRGELAAFGPHVDAVLPQVLDDFYRLLSDWEDTRPLVPAPAVERLKRQVLSYWQELFRGAFDRPYAASRSLVGLVHERVGLSAPLYLVGLAQQVASLLRVALRTARPERAVDALLRAVFFDLSFVLQAYVDARAEAVLRSGGFANELLAGMTAGVAIVDARLRVESVNPALLAMFGLDARLVRQVLLSELLPPGVVELARRAWAGAPRLTTVVCADQRTFRVTAMRLAAPAGSSKPTVGLVLDEITELVRVQSEQSDDARAHGEVMDAVGALVWEADDSDAFTLTLVSRSALEVTGTRDVGLLGRPDAFVALVPEPDRAAFLARTRALAPGERVELRHRLRRAGGDTLWLRSLVTRERTGPASSVLRGVSIDVTAAQLEEQARLDAVAALAGGAAHEYNNRLTVILGGLDLIEESLQDPELTLLLAEARRSADLCAGLTKQLLGFAQRQALRPVPIVPNEVLGSVRETLAAMMGDAIDLELQLAPNLWPCHVDPRELASSIVALAANAKDSMPNGGRLTIITRNVAEPASAAEQVEIVVVDTGVGMDEPVRRRAFEPFFSTKPGARGLGLSGVRGFVAQSGGQVSLSSQRGGGTVVRLVFPRVPDSTFTVLGDGPNRACVLLVDDEASLRQVVSQIVTRAGHAVIAVGTIAEALAVLEARTIDVLLTDVVLSGDESGLDLAPMARRLQPELPVVFISGFTQDAVRLASLGPGEWFLPKPFSPRALREQLTAALDYGREAGAARGA